MVGDGQGAVWVLLFATLTVIGLVLLTVLAVRFIGGGLRGPGDEVRAGPVGRGVTGPADAREILAERYARGDIDAEEYRERLRVLEDGP